MYTLTIRKKTWYLLQSPVAKRFIICEKIFYHWASHNTVKSTIIEKLNKTCDYDNEHKMRYV